MDKIHKPQPKAKELLIIGGKVYLMSDSAIDAIQQIKQSAEDHILFGKSLQGH